MEANMSNESKELNKSREIVTVFEYPPIPIRDYDWAAFRYDHSEWSPVGRGATEEAAIQDLLERESEQ
jgi:hypothetical protein